MNGVGGMMIQNKDAVIASAGRDRETTGLIGMRLEQFLLVEEHDTNLVAVVWIKLRRDIFVENSGGRSFGKRRFGGAQMLCFLILMTEDSSNRFGEMLGDEFCR